MKNVKLIKPSKEYRESFNQMIKDYIDNNEEFSKITDFDVYFKYLDLKIRGEFSKLEGVKQYEHWLVDDCYNIIGTSRIRDRLIEKLRFHLGNLGYDISPSFRKNGYGKIILKLTLDKVKLLGLKKVLLTVDEGNIASEKIIIANGGIYEGSSYVDAAKKVIWRYWINIKEGNDK